MLTKNSEVVTNEDGFEVVLEHGYPGESGVTIFTVSISHVATNSFLHSYEFEHAYLIAAREIARRYGEYMMHNDRKVVILARALAKELGFEADLSKGIDNFFKDVASFIATQDFEDYIQGITYELFKIALENELKTRKEIQNEKLDYV